MHKYNQHVHPVSSCLLSQQFNPPSFRKTFVDIFLGQFVLPQIPLDLSSLETAKPLLGHCVFPRPKRLLEETKVIESIGSLSHKPPSGQSWTGSTPTRLSIFQQVAKSFKNEKPGQIRSTSSKCNRTDPVEIEFQLKKSPPGKPKSARTGRCKRACLSGGTSNR